jgi:hypothetical protein
MSIDLPHPLRDGIYRIKRGLAGYISYLAACEMNEAFSEYVLYEPTLRILTALKFTVKCEYPCPGFAKKSRGDVKKLDFLAHQGKWRFAMEMKWAKSARLDINRDVEKLALFKTAEPSSLALICVFGRRSFLEHLRPTVHNLRERGAPVYAEFGNTRYGCRIFDVAKGATPNETPR